MKKKSKKRNIIIAIIGIIIAIIVAIAAFTYFKINKISSAKLDESNISVTKEEDMPKVNESETNKSKNKVRNILLLGVDNQEKASDSNIVLSIDETSKKVKLTSLMRDSYVFYGDGKINKLNYAYHYGGEQLSVKTVNEQFKLDIKDYIKVDFEGLSKIIDFVGGIEVDIKDEEVKYINSYSKDIAKINKTQYTPIAKAGKQVLNGEQATAYCRIRYVGNNDYERTDRQRTILTKVMNKLLQKSITEYPDIVNQIMPYVQTSLTPLEIISLGKDFSFYAKNGIMQSRCPYDGFKEDSYIDKIYYMKWDKEENIQKLHGFIYSDK